MTEMNRTDDVNSAKPVFLLEIGTEEIPARFFPLAMDTLKDLAGKLFADYRLSFRLPKVFATPRRLVLTVEIDPRQNNLEMEVWGPPVSVAFTSEGEPTKAAEAFARNNGVSPSDLVVREKGKGKYTVALVREAGKPAIEILPDVIRKIILSLSFPKTMRWGSGSIRFARPIHWIFSLYNNEKIVCEIEHLRCGTVTRGHRFLSPASFEVRDTRAFFNMLRNNYVILDPDERRKIIVEGSRRLAAFFNASLVEDAGLLQEIVFLIEYPMPVSGVFPAQYLSLPRELLITVMRDHQKYFALENLSGALTNHFIVVSNSKIENAATIIKGAEKVLRARFEDARFYYEQDRKISSAARLEMLKKVIFHDRLGTLHDKTLRVAAIAGALSSRCCPDDNEMIRTAAMLSKTDLVSGVVREFPELQGIMGGYYARIDGYGDMVCSAISEHYLPVSSGGKLPGNIPAAIVSLADKIDTLCSFFSIGAVPTGTEDPFGLRRQALGIVAIFLEKKLPMTLSELVHTAFLHVREGDQSAEAVLGFFRQRIESFLIAAGYPQDAVASVMAFALHEPLALLMKRIGSVSDYRTAEYCPSLLLAFKRIANIAPKSDISPPSEHIFTQDEETVLFRETQMRKGIIDMMIEKGEFTDAIRVLEELVGPVNLFFDRVLVMDKDESVRQNRLALVESVHSLTLMVADFSKLT